MAGDDPQALCERLFVTFLAPLVLGGEMRPEKPIGGKGALTIGDDRRPADVDLLSRTQLARVRVARKLAPIDRFEPAPTASEWAIAAVVHDLVQATHPGFDALFRRSGPKRLLDVIDMTLERIPPPQHARDALSRHSWFSRMLDLTRTDVTVQWWTGSEKFLGTDPPKRLLAWPELRRVQQVRTPHLLMELPAAGSAVDPVRFGSLVESALQKTPLTDLATMTRDAPAFVWTHETLALCATPAGRTIVLRALSLLPDRAVDRAIGRATRRLLAARATRALLVAVDLLRDRALLAAAARIRGSKDPAPIRLDAAENDAAFAIGTGAIVASHWIVTTGGGFSEPDRHAILAVLAPAAASTAAREVMALLAA